MLIIYGSDLSGPANKVRMTANYLGLKYEYKKIDLRGGEQKKPEFLKINPAGKIPAIDDDGFLLFESGAIIKYLSDKNKSALYPHGLKERAAVDQWLDFITLHVGGAMQKITYNRVFAQRIGVAVDENSLKEGQAFLARFLPVVEEQLSKNPCIVGKQLTLADIALLTILDPAEVSGVDLSPYPQIMKWRNNLRAQDFYTACHKEYGESLKQAAKT